MKKTWMMLMLLLCASIPAWAADDDLADLADDIVDQANHLKKIAYDKTYLNHRTDQEIAQTLKQLELLIAACEKELNQPTARPQPPQPPDHPRPPHHHGPESHIIGNTSPADGSIAVLYTSADMRKIPFRKLTIEHLGGARYIRMADIKVVDVDGQTFTINAGGGKFYPGDEFEVELPGPTRISEVSVYVRHSTIGLQITGQAAPQKPELPTLIELGISNGVKDGLAVLNLSERERRLEFRKLQFRHTGGDEYIRLTNLEIVSPDDKTIPLNIPYTKLRSDELLEIDLPTPMKIKTVRVRAQHRTDGLSISGVR